jgi:hypothetical protein
MSHCGAGLNKPLKCNTRSLRLLPKYLEYFSIVNWCYVLKSVTTIPVILINKSNIANSYYGLVWCIMFNATFKKYFNYMEAVSFTGGGNRSTRRKPTCRRLLTTLSHNVLSSTPCHERGSNSQL